MGSRKPKFGYQIDATDYGPGSESRMVLPGMGQHCILLARKKVQWHPLRRSIGMVRSAGDFLLRELAEYISESGDCLEVCAVDLDTGIWMTVWALSPEEVTRGFSEAQEAIRAVKRQSAFLRENNEDVVKDLIGEIIEEIQT